MRSPHRPRTDHPTPDKQLVSAISNHLLFHPFSLAAVTIITGSAVLAGHQWWLVLLITFVILPILCISAAAVLGVLIWFAEWVSMKVKVNPPG